jgi:hypothetical protein
MVARWYRWIYLAGLAAAVWFFGVYFAPATIRLAAWIVASIAHAGAGSERFWEALVFGALIFSPRLITFAVALRDLRRWRERRPTSPSSSTANGPTKASRAQYERGRPSTWWPRYARTRLFDTGATE